MKIYAAEIIGNQGTGSFSGSFTGNGSNLTNIVSSSYAASSSYSEQLKSFGCGILGGSTLISAGFYNTKRIESKGIIYSYRIDSMDSYGNALSGSITFVLNKNNSFLGSASLSASNTTIDTTLSGWTTRNILPDDKIDFYIINNDLITNSILSVNYTQQT